MIAIQILGVHGHKSTKTLKANMIKALRDLNLAADVEEVNDIDDLMQFDISGVPAVVVDGKLAFQQVIPEVDAIKSLFESISQNSLKPLEEVKKILIPTDFSPTATDAYHYAQHLFKDNAYLKALHVYHPHVDPAFSYTKIVLENAIKDKETELKRWVKNQTNTKISRKNVHCETIFKVGFPADVIVKESAEDIDMIVMGGTGVTNVIDQFFGSVASHVAKNASCPVLLVPAGFKFSGMNRILCATASEEFGKETLKHLDNLGLINNPSIHCVHITEKNGADYKVVVSKEENMDCGIGLLQPVQFVEIEDNSIIDGLQEYANQQKIDLIVMSTQHRGWLESIIHKSITKRMAMQSSIPLLVQHMKQ